MKADGLDWRTAEGAINAYEHYRVDVGGVPVHFMRKPGVGPNPVRLVLSHGWPWTFWHWSKVIDPLADPAAFGDDPADAFDVIVPSLPGFGFSTPLTNQQDMNFWKIADVWHELMTGVLGYEYPRDDLLGGQRNRHIDPHLRQQQPLPVDAVA